MNSACGCIWAELLAARKLRCRHRVAQRFRSAGPFAALATGPPASLYRRRAVACVSRALLFVALQIADSRERQTHAALDGAGKNGTAVTARSAELPVRSYQLMRNGVRGDRTTANRESRIVEAMKKPRPTTAATTRTKSCAHATRAAWSMEPSQ